MTTLQTKSFDDVVQAQAAAVQAGSTRVLADFSVGSLLRAVIEASAAVVMWMQGLILHLLTTTRAATATGTDLDTWMADYGLIRLPAVAATGAVTFARFTPTMQATIPVGSLVQTADGSQIYAVIADVGQAAYNAILGAYVIPAGTASITASIVSTSTGSGSNAIAGAINTLGQAISGVDTVTNGAAFANGIDAETDGAFRARFVSFIASLSRATKAAVGNAIASTQPGLTYTIVEKSNYAGAAQNGYFYVVIDDGSGYPPTSLLTAITTAIEAVRPLGTSFGVFAPSVVTANVAASITTATGYDHAAVSAGVTAAIAAYIAALPMGPSLVWARLFQVAFDASPGVVGVPTLSINGASADLAATAQQAIIAGTVSVS